MLILSAEEDLSRPWLLRFSQLHFSLTSIRFSSIFILPSKICVSILGLSLSIVEKGVVRIYTYSRILGSFHVDVEEMWCFIHFVFVTRFNLFQFS